MSAGSGQSLRSVSACVHPGAHRLGVPHFAPLAHSLTPSHRSPFVSYSRYATLRTTHDSLQPWPVLRTTHYALLSLLPLLRQTYFRPRQACNRSRTPLAPLVRLAPVSDPSPPTSLVARYSRSAPGHPTSSSCHLTGHPLAGQSQFHTPRSKATRACLTPPHPPPPPPPPPPPHYHSPRISLSHTIRPPPSFETSLGRHPHYLQTTPSSSSSSSSSSSPRPPSSNLNQPCAPPSRL